MTKRKLLSGNYEPAREASIETEKEEKKETEFEEAVLKKLGGSFAFVRGKKFVEPATRSGGRWLKEIEDELWKRNLIPECVQKGEKHDANKHSCLHFSGTSHAGLATKEVLDTMRRIGFSVLDYGLESFSREILRDLGKGASPERNANAIRLTLECGLQPIPNQIVGFPLETWNTIYEMLDAWEKFGIVTVPFLMTPYPGSQWYNEFKSSILEQYNGNLESFLSDLGDATKTTAIVNKNFTAIELVGIQNVLGTAAKTGDFVNARRLLRLSEKEWLRRRAIS